MSRVGLVCAGQYHDIDYARLELLKLLGEHDAARVWVTDHYSIGDRLGNTDCLITYTCNVVASATEAHQLREWLRAGGRWFALHGTNSVLEFVSMKPLQVDTPNSAPEFMAILGSQFQAHPPIAEYEVKVADVDDPLIAGLKNFTTVDEKYLCKVDAEVETLMYCEHDEAVDEFVQTDWRETTQQPVLYRHRHGDGEVVYLTLGHCRGHYDMQPLMDYYPRVERCSWETPEFHELLRRGIRWGLGA